jgi:hypothetical protein
MRVQQGRPTSGVGIALIGIGSTWPAIDGDARRERCASGVEEPCRFGMRLSGQHPCYSVADRVAGTAALGLAPAVRRAIDRHKCAAPAAAPRR